MKKTADEQSGSTPKSGGKQGDNRAGVAKKARAGIYLDKGARGP